MGVHDFIDLYNGKFFENVIYWSNILAISYVILNINKCIVPYCMVCLILILLYTDHSFLLCLILILLIYTMGLWGTWMCFNNIQTNQFIMTFWKLKLYNTICCISGYNEDGWVSHACRQWRQHKLGRGLGAETQARLMSSSWRPLTECCI